MQWKGIRKMPDYRFKHGNLRYPTLVRNLFHFLMKFILGSFFWWAVHGPVRPFHGLIRSFHGPVRPFHGLSMVCPRVIFSEIFSKKDCKSQPSFLIHPI